MYLGSSCSILLTDLMINFSELNISEKSCLLISFLIDFPWALCVVVVFFFLLCIFKGVAPVSSGLDSFHQEICSHLICLSEYTSVFFLDAFMTLSPLLVT